MNLLPRRKDNRDYGDNLTGMRCMQYAWGGRVLWKSSRWKELPQWSEQRSSIGYYPRSHLVRRRFFLQELLP